VGSSPAGDGDSTRKAITSFGNLLQRTITTTGTGSQAIRQQLAHRPAAFVGDIDGEEPIPGVVEVGSLGSEFRVQVTELSTLNSPAPRR
jgi:hypothetical protein